MCGPLAQGIYPRIPDTRVQAEAVVQCRVDKQCIVGHWAHFASQQCQAKSFFKVFFLKANTNRERFVHTKKSVLNGNLTWFCIRIYNWVFLVEFKSKQTKRLCQLLARNYLIKRGNIFKSQEKSTTRFLSTHYISHASFHEGYIGVIKSVKFNVKYFNDCARLFKSQQCKCASLSFTEEMQWKLQGCVPCWRTAR